MPSMKKMKKMKRMKDKPVNAFKTVIELQRKCNEDGEKVWQRFSIDDGKSDREFNLVASVIEVRLEKNVTYYLHLLRKYLIVKPRIEQRQVRKEMAEILVRMSQATTNAKKILSLSLLMRQFPF